MLSRPKVVAFDIIGTTFSLEPVRKPLVALGLPDKALELWFAIGLRDAFALACTGGFQPFTSVLQDALDQALALHGREASAAQKQQVIEAMANLPQHDDAREAHQILAEAEIRILALSNGSASSTRRLIDQAGLQEFVEQVVSTEDVKLSKPRPEVYQHAAQVAGVGPAELALIATHAWDIHGAKQAGLKAGFVARGQTFPSCLSKPDVQGENLVEVARRFADLPR